MRRIGHAALLALLALGMGTPGAGASMVFNGTLSTPTSVDASTRTVVYYLQMHSTAEREERFSVRLAPPPFAMIGGLDEGQSLTGPRSIALQGPGTLGQTVADGRFVVSCSERTSAYHGYTTGASTVDVLLPAGSATTLAVRYATGRRAPWVDSDFRLTFSARPKLVGTYEADSPFALGPTLTQTTTLITAGPVVRGRTGAHLILNTNPSATRGPTQTPRSVRRGEPITIRGRMLPARGRRRVVLQWARHGGALRTLATVRTDARGRFTAPAWRLGAADTYELWARYPQQSGGLVADGTSCPLRFRAR